MALKEVDAFEWEGDYESEAAKRLILEKRMDEELEQYLGPNRYCTERGGPGGLSEWVLSASPFDGDRRSGDSGSSENSGRNIEGVERERERGLQEAVPVGGSADHGLFCIGDEY